MPDTSSLRRCQMATLCLVIVAVICIGVPIMTNLVAKSKIELAGTEALGVTTRVGGVSLNVFSERSTISDICISSPAGYDADLVTLKHGHFDLNFWDAVRQQLFGSPAPIELEDIVIHDLQTYVISTLDGSTNAGYVLDHVLKHMQLGQAVKSTMRFIVDKVELANITGSVGLLPINSATGPLSFTLGQVVLQDVGAKDRKGVSLHELIQEIVSAVLNAVLHQVGAGLAPKAQAAIDGLKNQLGNLPTSAAEVYADAGEGLQKVHEWADSAASQIGDGVSYGYQHTKDWAKDLPVPNSLGDAKNWAKGAGSSVAEDLSDGWSNLKDAGSSYLR